MTGITVAYSNIKRSLIAAGVLLAFDLAFLGTLFVSELFCPVWFIAILTNSLIRRPGWRISLVKLAIPLTVFGIVWLNSDFQLRIADANAKRVVTACEDYHATNGKFPENLEELVPHYMNSVPFAKYCLGPPRRFNYYYNSGSPMLVWQIVPPYYRGTYNFVTRRWGHLD